MKRSKLITLISCSMLVIFSFVALMVSLPITKQQQQSLIDYKEILAEKELEAKRLEYSFNYNGKFEIYTLDQFKAFRDAVNGGDTFSGDTITLYNNIDLSSVSNFEPIGKTSSLTFNGTFDGNGFAIKNLTIQSTNEFKCLGLFGYVNGATIKNLTVTINSITQSNDNIAGGVVGSATNLCGLSNIIVLPNTSDSSISCVDKGYLAYIGGIVGHILNKSRNAEICQCANFVNLKTSSARSYIGGIVGCCTTENYKKVTVEQCYNNGSVLSTNEKNTLLYLGGIVGQTSSDDVVIDSCINNAEKIEGHSTGTSSSKSTSPTSGTLRDNVDNLTIEYLLKNSNSSSVVSGIYMGGICGYTKGTIKNCLSYTTDITTPQSSSSSSAKFFYGRYGDTVYPWYCYYGDMIDASIRQTKNHYQPIAWGCTPESSYSYSYSVGNYSYNTSVKYVVFDEIVTSSTIKYSKWGGKITNYWLENTTTNIPITDLFNAPSSGKIYYRYGVNKSVQVSGVYFIDGHPFKDAYYPGFVFNNKLANSAFILGFNKNNEPSGLTIVGYVTEDTKYNQIYTTQSAYSVSGSGGNYTTKIAETFSSSSNDTNPNDWYNNSDKCIIRNTNIYYTQSSIGFMYGYDYWTKNGTKSVNDQTKSLSPITWVYEACTISSNNFKDTSAFQKLSMGDAFANSSGILDGKPHLKWMYWSDNIQIP